ncbi:MAG: GH36-type glycosyl hydrolase domain-containing protein, partial [Chthoniobacterales bacterium]
YFGDWNDSLNIGRGGKGESVWLGMALLVALRDTKQIAERLNDTAVAEQMDSKISQMESTIESCAWDGEWYLRGFDDEAHPVGSKSSPAGHIFSEPQSWAVFAQLNPTRLKQVAASVTKHLRTDTGLVVCNPPFRTYDPAYGRISAMPAGWGENGSCYCHVTAFQAVADCLVRDGDAALQSLMSLVPFNPAISIDKSWLEPYAFSNMFRGPEHPRPSATFKGWTSGTVPWVLQCMTHYLLGVRPDYDSLIIDPVLPSTWDKVSLSRTYQGVQFEIAIHNPRKLASKFAQSKLVVNGSPYEGNRLFPQDYPNGQCTVKVDILPI